MKGVVNNINFLQGLSRIVTKKHTLNIAMLVASACKEDSFNKAGGGKILITVTGIMIVGGKEEDIVGINFV